MPYKEKACGFISGKKKFKIGQNQICFNFTMTQNLYMESFQKL